MFRSAARGGSHGDVPPKNRDRSKPEVWSLLSATATFAACLEQRSSTRPALSEPRPEKTLLARGWKPSRMIGQRWRAWCPRRR